MTRIRTYSELAELQTFEERFDYLVLGGSAGVATFGFDRYLNQMFYKSREWEDARRYTIIRDNGCDLGILGLEIFANILIHHVNPMNPDDIIHKNEQILDPEYLITTTLMTHNAIHFGNKDMLVKSFVERKPNDTKLW